MGSRSRWLNDREKLALEDLVDKHDIEAVLMALSEIAFAKADHILNTYSHGDSPEAKRYASMWAHDARIIETAATKIKSP